MNASDPEILLDGYIKSVVNKELHHAGVMADGPVNRAPQESTTATKVVEAIADAKSKNGFSPGGCQEKIKGSSSKQNKGKGKGKKTGKGKGKNKSTKSSAKNNKKKNVSWQGQRHEAQPELNSGVSMDSRKERRVQRNFERRAFCARTNERKNSRVSRLFVYLLKNARAADNLHLVHSENFRKQVLVLSPESRSVSEVGASEVVPWLVIWSLARYQRSHVWYTGTRPRMEALVHDFQQFAAKVRWKWHFREEPREFYIHLKNSRYIPPYPLVTPPELEGCSVSACS